MKNIIFIDIFKSFNQIQLKNLRTDKNAFFFGKTSSDCLVFVGDCRGWYTYDLHFEGGGGGFLFKIGRPRLRGWKNSGHRWTGEWRVSKIGQFYGRHMCIVPNYHLIKHLFVNLKKKLFQCFQNILSVHVFAFFMKSIIWFIDCILFFYNLVP